MKLWTSPTMPGNPRRVMLYRCYRGVVLRLGRREYVVQRQRVCALTGATVKAAHKEGPSDA